jgi:hypothetical protein
MSFRLARNLLLKNFGSLFCHIPPTVGGHPCRPTNAFNKDSNVLKRNPEDSHVYRKILTGMFDPSRGRTNANIVKPINLSSL